MSDEIALDVRSYRLSEELRPYFMALYCFDIRCDGDALLRDLLHPEWSVIRFTASGSPPMAAIVPGAIRATHACVASGPTSKAIDFALTTSRIWGLGLRPAGWARYVRAEARSMADSIVDAGSHPAFALFAPVLEEVCVAQGEPDGIAQNIDGYLVGMDPVSGSDETKILAAQEALLDPEIADVETLARAVGVGRRTLERLCARHFGFPPKLLLRRQRFLRSLARFMLEPRHNWSKALDGQYFDQAHFVRDFRSFMGMRPSEYAETPHPVLDRIMAQRMADHGAAPQTELPTVLRYAGNGGGGNASRD